MLPKAKNKKKINLTELKKNAKIFKESLEEKAQYLRERKNNGNNLSFDSYSNS